MQLKPFADQEKDTADQECRATDDPDGISRANNAFGIKEYSAS
jgi:hypothetical protein